MKILNICGTRPNLIKFIDITGKDILVWTGQHFSESMMSLKIKEPKYNLDSVELEEMIMGLKSVCRKENPDCILVYGDTRSALAGALVAAEFSIPLAHYESGVRLGNMGRIEEKIRIMIDSISDFLFCINDFHADNLEAENVKGKYFIVGDLHYDRYLQGREHKDYTLVTIHRAEHTDNKLVLENILESLADKGDVIFPIHPRTDKKIKEYGLEMPENVKVTLPINYNEMQKLIKEAKLVMTDSGGVARESYFSGTPVKFIGDSEWESEIRMFGDGSAEEKIRDILLRELNLYGRN